MHDSLLVQIRTYPKSVVPRALQVDLKKEKPLNWAWCAARARRMKHNIKRTGSPVGFVLNHQNTFSVTTSSEDILARAKGAQMRLVHKPTKRPVHVHESLAARQLHDEFLLDNEANGRTQCSVATVSSNEILPILAINRPQWRGQVVNETSNGQNGPWPPCRSRLVRCVNRKLFACAWLWYW